jgi:hypothetical protein
LRIPNFDQALVPFVKLFSLGDLSEPKHNNIKVVIEKDTLLIFSLNFHVIAVSAEIPFLFTHEFKDFDIFQGNYHVRLLWELLLRFIADQDSLNRIEV